MLPLEEARSRIRNAPDSRESRALLQLLQALETGEPYPLAELYEIDFESFVLALNVLRSWRLHRYAGFARNGIAEERFQIELRAG